MSILSRIFAPVAAQPIEAIGNLFDKLLTSDEEKAAGALALQKLAMEPHLLQAEINKISAAHRSIFVAGWRPFIGWVCGGAMAYAFIGRDLLAWALAIWSPDVAPPPPVSMEFIGTVLIGMLGMGGLRSFEKMQGVAK